MIIQEMYNHFKLPYILQRHMYRVAAIGSYILAHGDETINEIDHQEIIKALLVHDLGNVVKFRYHEHFSEDSLLPYTLEESKEMQQELRAQYGEDDHTATKNMLLEIGVQQKIIELTSYIGLSLIGKDLNMRRIIINYADLRVAPQWIVSLSERLDDVEKRYAPIWKLSTEKMHKIRETMSREETTLFNHLTIEPIDIKATTIEEIIPTLHTINI